MGYLRKTSGHLRNLRVFLEDFGLSSEALGTRRVILGRVRAIFRRLRITFASPRVVFGMLRQTSGYLWYLRMSSFGLREFYSQLYHAEINPKYVINFKNVTMYKCLYSLIPFRSRKRTSPGCAVPLDSLVDLRYCRVPCGQR